MCQLSVVNLHKKDLNIMTDYLMSVFGSKVHSDGFGFMYTGGYGKTVHPPQALTDFGSFVSETVKSNYPIYSHIRQASHGVPVCKENSHPFESKDFLLMHNGTLVRGGEKRSYVQNQESDSKKFLEELQKEFETDKNFPESFNRTMGKFWGKFAFLIYVKKEKQYYICRGTTAQLYISYLLGEEEAKQGYIINTDKDNIEMAERMLSNFSQILYKTELSFTDPILLEANAIFKSEDTDIVKIADTKENDEKDFEPKTTTSIVKAALAKSVDAMFPQSKINQEDSLNKDSPIYKICRYMLNHLMTPKDIALIFKIYMGMDIFEADNKELFLFATQILPEIRSDISTQRFLFKQFKYSKMFPTILYKDYGLEFPWPINNPQNVIKAVKKYQKDEDRAIKNS